MITRSSIAFEDFLGSSIAPQVMPPWLLLDQHLKNSADQFVKNYPVNFELIIDAWQIESIMTF